MAAVTVNGRSYNFPRRPTVVVCIDGGDPTYVADGLQRGLLPAHQRFQEQGCWATAEAVVPTFTNPNNLSIVTGVLPAVHGICGNYFLDPDTGQEVMMNEPRFLRAESLLAALSRQGARVAVVTAKDKLRRLLGHGLQEGICFSAEKAHEVTAAEHGISEVNALVGWDTPEVYSSQLSEFVLEAGLRLYEQQRPDIMYLSLTDYIQHKHAPGTPGSDRFYQQLDRYFGAFDELGAVLGLTADHGMNDKNTPTGEPQIIYLGALLEDWLGCGKARVILPITDPYVVHHGALGSFATVYLDTTVDVARVIPRLQAEAGVAYVQPRARACEDFGLPADRMGDLVVISTRHTVLGKTPTEHDLSLLEGGLRSHGGITEQAVPFIINRPVLSAYQERLGGTLRNFDIFDFVLNGTLI
ncbi:MAG: phosphonoacetate hydrolase [Candidatus Tectimicrobiota bacterium]